MPSALKAEFLILTYSFKFWSIGLMNAKTCLSWNTSDTLKISPPLATLMVSITSRIGSFPCSAASSKTLFKSIPNVSSKFLIANGEVTF